MPNITRTCLPYKGNCHQERSIQIAGPDSKNAEYQNVYIVDGNRYSLDRTAGGTIHRDDLIWLRDQLIALYPLERAINPKREFTVGAWDFDFASFPIIEKTEKLVVNENTLGYFHLRQEAEWAAQALTERNEREAA